MAFRETLKHYETYIKNLNKYAIANHIKVVYAPEDSDGSYSPSKRRIRIDPDLCQSQEIAVFLHELGHSLDDIFIDERYKDLVNDAYAVIYTKKFTPAQKQLVISCERRAWKFARNLAKQLKIRLGKWFDEVQDYCLEQYE